jgi:microcystin-dependent protein
MARNYSSISEPKTLTANVSSSGTQITLNNVTGLPSAPYVLVLNPDTANEEVILVTADQTGVTSPTLKVNRAIENGASAKTHTAGDTARHMIVGSDLQVVHDHFSDNSLTTGTAHGVSGGVVGRTSSQTVTNKTMTGTDNTFSAIPQSAITSLVSDLALKAPLANPTFTGTVTLPTGTVSTTMIADNAVVTGKIADGTIVNADINASAAIDWTKLAVSSTVSATEIGYVDGVTSAIQTQLNALQSSISALSLIPVGTITMYGGTSAPTGWLLCDGGSTTGYTALATLVGATVPDLRGRAPIGYGQGTSLTNRSTIGATVGTETHALTESEMPRHNHSSLILGSGSSNTGLTVGSVADTQTSTGYTGGDGSGTAENGIAHNNMQPSTVVNFIIKH